MSAAEPPEDADRPPEADSIQPEPDPQPDPEPWPELDEDALRTGRFMMGDRVPGGQLAVTARDGEIQASGAPAKLLAELVAKIGQAVEGAGNLPFSPYVLLATPAESMRIVFGEPEPLGAQTKLPEPRVWDSSVRIARLIPQADDALMASARRLGNGARAYVDLASFIQSHGLTLDWEPVGARGSILTPEQAGRQHAQLTRPALVRQREMTITGRLTRAIYDGPGRGKAGIRLAQGSPLPPHRQGLFVVVRYESAEIEEQVIHHLLGQPVRATLRIDEPDPATSLFAESQTAILTAIEPASLAEPMLFEDDNGDDVA